MMRAPPSSPLFPYPPLFRSSPAGERLRLQAPPAGLASAGITMTPARVGSAPPSQRMRRDDGGADPTRAGDRKSTRLNSSHDQISYAVFCLKKKQQHTPRPRQ